MVQTRIWQHIWDYSQCVFKASKRLLFSLFIINKHVCLQCSTIKKCVFKARERLRFSLFIINQYCTPNILLQKICVQSNWEAAFQFIHHESHILKCFYCEFYKTFVKRCFLDCCFLVYLANYIKFLRMAAFQFVHQIL